MMTKVEQLVVGTFIFHPQKLDAAIALQFFKVDILVFKQRAICLLFWLHKQTSSF